MTVRTIHIGKKSKKSVILREISLHIGLVTDAKVFTKFPEVAKNFFCEIILCVRKEKPWLSAWLSARLSAQLSARLSVWLSDASQSVLIYSPNG